MKALSNSEIQEKRAQAQSLGATVHVGKSGVTQATVAELAAQLKRRKLVKVRLLAAATEGGLGDTDAARRLAEATGSTLIETRGHTAVFWRA